MKRVLITGKEGYIGSSLDTYLKKTGSPVAADRLSLRDDGWEKADFSRYDSVVHLVGIAHIKETPENRQLYYDVNRDLTVKVAEKAKREGVKQFVFISTMAVYGMDSGVITGDTVPAPKNAYGRSKLEAEELLRGMEDDGFKVCIVRPPMVYGYQCKGNFRKLTALVEKLPVFPRIHNQRSMIYIDNLCEFINRRVIGGGGGIYCPQNREYVSTNEIALLAAKRLGKKIYLSRLLGAAVWCIRPFVGMAEKAFGTLIYSAGDTDFSYCVVEKDASITRSVSPGG